VSEGDAPAGTRSWVLLWGVEPLWLDALLTTATLLGLLLSRLALLASGPWEWDETLFARGLMHFELGAHFPHPPGFPGWLALGQATRLIVGEPLVALQVASALLSVIAVWPLAALGRRVAPASVAAAAALALSLAPGPWLHAVRGFSSTPAAALVLLAGAAAASGRVTGFTVLVGAALLVRPILLPPLAVLWVGVAASVRPLRRLLPGVALVAAAVLASVWSMVALEGGVTPFVSAFTTHAGRHFARLASNPGGWADLGLVKGLGGSLVTAFVAVLAAAGVAVWWRRRGRAEGLLWLVVLGVAVAQLLLLSNRTYPRYAVPVQLATAPLLAAAASRLGPRVATALLLALAVFFGVRSYPLVEEQHATRLGSWAAVEMAEKVARRHGLAVVVEPELHPFASYLWHLRGGGRLAPEPQLVLSPWAPEPWGGVDRPYLVATCHPDLYPGPLVTGALRFSSASAALRPLTQGRMLEAVVVSNPPLPLSGFWPAEEAGAGERFMWFGGSAELELPPLPLGTTLGLELEPAPAPGPSPVEVTVNGVRAATVAAESGRAWWWVDPGLLRADRSNRVGLGRAETFVPGGGDDRELAARLCGVRVVGPGLPWGGPVASTAERAALALEGVGLWGAEGFGSYGRGCWLEPSARLLTRAGAGTLSLELWAPRPTSPETVVRVAGRVVAGPLALGPSPAEVVVTLGAGDVIGGRVEVELDSVPFQPSGARTGPDRRELGVVLSRVRFEPAVLSPLAEALVRPGGDLTPANGAP